LNLKQAVTSKENICFQLLRSLEASRRRQKPHAYLRHRTKSMHHDSDYDLSIDDHNALSAISAT